MDGVLGVPGVRGREEDLSEEAYELRSVSLSVSTIDWRFIPMDQWWGVLLLLFCLPGVIPAVVGSSCCGGEIISNVVVPDKRLSKCWSFLAVIVWIEEQTCDSSVAVILGQAIVVPVVKGGKRYSVDFINASSTLSTRERRESKNSSACSCLISKAI